MKQDFLSTHILHQYRHFFIPGILILLFCWWFLFATWPQWFADSVGGKKILINTLLNGVTLAGLYFLVASGFTLIFGLMRNINLAHGSLYLLGAYIGYEAADLTGFWVIGVLTGFVGIALVGVGFQYFIFRRMADDDLRQTLVTIGISIVFADLMLAVWGGTTYQYNPPEWAFRSLILPIVVGLDADATPIFLKYPIYRLIVLLLAILIGFILWLVLHKTRLGLMVRAGVDDRQILASSGVNIQKIFMIVFAIGAGLAGFAGVIGSTALSISPGDDVRYFLASLIVVIVGGIGSIAGAALGALIIGIAEQVGLVYFPTYGVLFTFLIMVVVLALRPHGLLGKDEKY